MPWHSIVPFLPAVLCAFMLCSSMPIFYVAASLSILGIALLFSEFERAVERQDPVRRHRLKIAIQVLAMLLNTLFTYRVTSVLQSPFTTAVVWSIAGISSVLVFHLLLFLPTLAAAVQPDGSTEAANVEDGKAFGVQLLGGAGCIS